MSLSYADVRKQIRFCKTTHKRAIDDSVNSNSIRGYHSTILKESEITGILAYKIFENNRSNNHLEEPRSIMFS